MSGVRVFVCVMTARKRLHDYDNDGAGPSSAKRVTVQLMQQLGSLVPRLFPPIEGKNLETRLVLLSDP